MVELLPNISLIWTPVVQFNYIWQESDWKILDYLLFIGCYLCDQIRQKFLANDSLLFCNDYFSTFFRYPMCLYFLDLLQHEHFRREIVNAQCAKFIDDQILLLWQHYTRRRTKFLQTAMESHNVNNTSSISATDNMNGNSLIIAKSNGLTLPH